MIITYFHLIFIFSLISIFFVFNEIVIFLFFLSLVMKFIDKTFSKIKSLEILIKQNEEEIKQKEEEIKQKEEEIKQISDPATWKQIYSINNNYQWKIAILLTSCRRPQVEDNYLVSINMWLKKTTLPIFIVESNSKGFPEFENTRLRCYITKKPIRGDSSSFCERDSILEAMEHFESEMKNYNYIIKITAKYYVEIEHMIFKLQNKKTDLIYQNSNQKNWNNSEIFGFRPELYLYFRECNTLMEHFIYELSGKYNFNYIRLPKINNILLSKRGDGSILQKL